MAASLHRQAATPRYRAAQPLAVYDPDDWSESTFTVAVEQEGRGGPTATLSITGPNSTLGLVGLTAEALAELADFCGRAALNLRARTEQAEAPPQLRNASHA